MEEDNSTIPLVEGLGPVSLLVSRNLMSVDATSVIVQKEPDECQIKDIHHASLMNDNYITLSVILSILSICTGCLPALCFSIPAIVYAVQARQAHAIGDFERMRSKEKSAFAMNIFVLLFWIVAFTLITVITYSAKCGFDGIYCNTAPREAV